MDNVKTYAIGGKTYEQRELSYGQILQLVSLLKSVDFPEQLTLDTLLGTLGDKLPPALAIVLTEQGRSPRDKDLAALADDLKFSITGTQIREVLADFFALTPVTSLIEAVTGGVVALAAFRGGWMRSDAPASGNLSPSAEETLPSETPSNGNSDLEPPDPG